MKYAALIAVFCALGAQATWCNYYYDNECQQDANGGTSFDCANPGIIGSGGSYVQCHVTKTNQETCIVTRCADQSCSNDLGSVEVSPGSSKSGCIATGGAGPWYEEKFQ